MKTSVKWLALTILWGGFALAADDKKDETQPKTDQEFLSRAIATDTAEIQMAETARKMTTNTGVQNFAQKMILDHTNNRASLEAIGKALKMDVAETMPKDLKEGVEKLSKLDKKDFDKDYIKGQVEGHQKALKLYETWAKNTRDENFRTAATKAILVVRGHLEAARRLAKELGVNVSD